MTELANNSMYYAYTARSVLNGIRVNASEKVVRQACFNCNNCNIGLFQKIQGL